MAGFSDKNIKVLSVDSADPYYLELENEKKHTPYETEVIFYGCIERGDVEGTAKMMSALWNQSVVVGRMSHNDLRQIQYFAVCCITLGIRAVIRGGVSEIKAYSLSDDYIQKIDGMTTSDQVVEFLSQKAVELAGMVAKNTRKKISKK